MIGHTHPRELGIRGESLALEHYAAQGCVLIDANYRTKRGEIDLIVFDPIADEVMFVEVKTRRGSAFGAAEAVTARKLARMRAAAIEWLRDKPYCDVRFDVVEIVLVGNGQAKMNVYEGVDDGAC